MTPDPSTETLAEAVREELPLREVSRITMPAYMRHAIEQTNAAHDALDALAARLSQAEEREAQYVAALKAARPFLGLEIRPRPGESIMPSAGAIVADALALAASSAGETGDG